MGLLYPVLKMALYIFLIQLENVEYAEIFKINKNNRPKSIFKKNPSASDNTGKHSLKHQPKRLTKAKDVNNGEILNRFMNLYI